MGIMVYSLKCVMQDFVHQHLDLPTSRMKIGHKISVENESV